MSTPVHPSPPDVPTDAPPPAPSWTRWLLGDAEPGRGAVKLTLLALAATSFDAIVPGLRITFSAGVAECAPGEDLHLAIDRADRALYRAKLAGRDRTISEFAPLA